MAKKKSNGKTVTLRFRVNKDLAHIIKHRSMFYFDGNMSEFFRYCVDNFKSPMKQKEKPQQTKKRVGVSSG